MGAIRSQGVAAPAADRGESVGLQGIGSKMGWIRPSPAATNLRPRRPGKCRFLPSLSHLL